jgi:glucose/mannose-6-phosphate isomerase
MIDLDDREALERLDPGGMLIAVEGFPEQCRAALELAPSTPLDLKGIERIIAAGMGGSGIVGGLLGRLIGLPVSANRGYGLPPVDGQSLVIGISYSGDTEETLSSVKVALERGARLLLISSDGELERLAEEHGLPLIKVPGGLQPRAALGYLLLPILRVLSEAGLFSEEELLRLPDLLQEIGAHWGCAVPLRDNLAKELARRLHGGVPLIYGVEGTTDVAALRWKTQINENSKQPAFWNVIPELCHNEIVGFERADLLSNVRVILLRSDLDYQRNLTRLEIMKLFFKGRGVEYEEARAAGEGRLAQLLSLIYLGDFVSVYLALLNGVDPTLVRPIAEFKERLRRWSSTEG